MYKGIEWLKREIDIEMMELEPNRKERWSDVKYQTLRNVAQKIDQLDEPEVLSREWVSDNAVVGQYPDGMGYVVPAYKLQNLLVPKQELPVIPKFVAEWIEKYRERESNVWHLLNNVSIQKDCKLELWSWLWGENNVDVLARAWLDGYTVEKEQKYILSINITDKASKTNYETFLNKRGIFHSMDNESYNNEEFNWTEKEIKDLESGEILFEYFAVKVEEMEE